MVEILRTNDIVLISVIESILRAERVAYFVADQNMAAAEGSLGFLPRRILVEAREEDGRDALSPRPVWEKNCAMAELSPRLEGPAIADGLTEDRWLGGRLTLVQPRRGHRVGTDAALLVAAAGTRGKAGSSTLAREWARSGWRWPSAQRSPPPISSKSIPSWRGSPRATRRVTGFRRARASCGSTRSNRRERREAGLLDEAAECVVTNPPFFEAKAVRASPDEGRARAHVLPRAEAGAALADWISASLAILGPKRAVRDDPSARCAWRDPRRDRRAARRAGAAARSSDAPARARIVCWSRA